MKPVKSFLPVTAFLPVTVLAAICALATPLLADSVDALGRKWTVPIGADWKVVDEGGTQVMQLLVKRPQEKPRRPKQFAVMEDATYTAFTLDVEVKRVEKSLILVYAYQDDDHFNYAHLSVDDPEKVAVHNGIFHVYGGDRVRISPREGGPGALPTTDWHHVKMTWSGKTGDLKVWVDGKTTGALHGIDLSLKYGKIGLGSFFETGHFKNLRIKGTTK